MAQTARKARGAEFSASVLVLKVSFTPTINKSFAALILKRFGGMQVCSRAAYEAANSRASSACHVLATTTTAACGF